MTRSDAGAVQVRRVKPGEWAELRQLRLRALADSPHAFGSNLARELAYPETTWQAWAARPIFVAVIETPPTRMVGMAGVAGPEAGEPWARLWGMWVAPEVRRRGVGSQLVEATLAWARQQGLEEVLLKVTDSNAEAAALYASLGFAPTGRSVPLPRDPTVTEHELSRRLWSRGP
jgi:GNAT superfamily N-acetyltransferase